MLNKAASTIISKGDDFVQEIPRDEDKVLAWVSQKTKRANERNRILYWLPEVLSDSRQSDAVIPAYAGIRFFQGNLDPGFRRGALIINVRRGGLRHGGRNQCLNASRSLSPSVFRSRALFGEGFQGPTVSDAVDLATSRGSASLERGG
jgi:hypothetical protein